MIRALRFLFIVTLGVFALVWLLDRPGSVVLDWQGYRAETSIAVLFGLVIGIAFATAQGYRIWLFLCRVPSQMTEAWRQRRKQQGYQALTKGMVAVSAGDAEEAIRSVKRAEVLLNEPPLTMLLSAQAAQLNGDEKAAEIFFKAMAENSETEFLGIRGLLGQAVKRDDTREALNLAQRAHRLRPKSAWAANHLFDLQTSEGLWLDARATAEELVRNKTISKIEGKNRKAVLYYQLGLDAEKKGEEVVAFDQFKRASDNDLAFSPAIGAYAEALIKKNQKKKALMLIKKTWSLAPHPSLLEIYWRACEAYEGLERVSQTDQLSKLNSGHIESQVARVRAHLNFSLWGEARNQLESIEKQNPNALDSRICCLWAELEEGEHGDMVKAHEWLSRASIVDSQAAWICGDCGNTVVDWVSNCGNCGSFNAFSWRRPLNVSGLSDPSPAHPQKVLAVIPSPEINLASINKTT
jgi:HemY protein